MTALQRGAVFALMLLGATGLAVSNGSKDIPEPYPRPVEIPRAPIVVCAQGSVEQRLDCLGRQIDELSRRLEDPRVVPL